MTDLFASLSPNCLQCGRPHTVQDRENYRKIRERGTAARAADGEPPYENKTGGYLCTTCLYLAVMLIAAEEEQSR